MRKGMIKSLKINNCIQTSVLKINNASYFSFLKLKFWIVQITQEIHTTNLISFNFILKNINIQTKIT